MPLRVSIHKYVFQFSFEARTSRGVMQDRTSWFVKLWSDENPAVFGVGECAPLAGLSIETEAEVELYLAKIEKQINNGSVQLPSKNCISLTELNSFLHANQIDTTISSVRFALETALLDLMNGGKQIIFKTKFLEGTPIPINGLIWMSNIDEMLRQIDAKIKAGFSCIKLKVGGLDFEKECEVLQYIREKYNSDDLVLRVDANGALKPEEALHKLNVLAKFGVHSIEQPIKQGLPEMVDLCRQSPVPIALDEELIGAQSSKAKNDLLSRIKPAYIILKPSLHGGLGGCKEWIEMAKKNGIGWWMTSALESSIGLNAIAQFTSSYIISIPQGLGTGTIYTNNIRSPLTVRAGELSYNSQIDWDLSAIFDLPKK
jgi:o-succinylbenzoate synthase